MSDIDGELHAALTSLEADYLDDLGKHEEAAKLRQTFAASVTPDAADLPRAFLDDLLGHNPLRMARQTRDEPVPNDGDLDISAGLVIDASDVRASRIRRLDAERAQLEERIGELRQFERHYRAAIGAHLALLEEMSSDDPLMEQIARYHALLDNPTGTAEPLK